MNPSNYNKKSQKGFSLIELLVVISIIAVLSSIAVINIASRAKLAKDVSVKNNLMILRGAVSRYYLENGKFPDDIARLSGAQLKNSYLKWDAANASGDIAYDAKSGTVYLKGKGGLEPSETDLKGVSYRQY